MLEDCGYITVEQEINSDGTFGRNIYTLIENPIPREKRVSAKKTVAEKTRYGKNPPPKKPTPKNNSISKNNSIFKNNTHTVPQTPEEPPQAKAKAEEEQKPVCEKALPEKVSGEELKALQ